MKTKVNKKYIESIFWGIGADHSNRFEIFLDIMHDLTEPDFWYGFRIAYEDTDDLYYFKDFIVELLINDWRPKYRKYMMDEDELKLFKELPKKVTIYRGMTVDELNSKNYGASWTLDKKIADFFAYKYLGNHATNHLPKTVHSIEIRKSRILALLNRRNEKAVIVLCKGE